jgi:hypothetical protein
MKFLWIMADLLGDSPRREVELKKLLEREIAPPYI